MAWGVGTDNGASIYEVNFLRFALKSDFPHPGGASCGSATELGQTCPAAPA